MISLPVCEDIHLSVCLSICLSVGLRIFQIGRRKDGNLLFNDVFNAFYLWLYGMVKDQGDSQPLPPHRLHFLISSKGSFICIIPHRIVHTTAFVKPVVEHWLER